MTIFDLDGTLLDITPRWLALHADATAHAGLPTLAPEEYVAHKREGMAEEVIMRAVTADAALIARYVAFRIEHIEDERYLGLDMLFPHATQILEAWSARGPLVLATKRAHHARCEAQLVRLGIREYFSRIIWADAVGKEAPLGAALVGMDVSSICFISDGPEDYRTSLALGLRPIVVAYGTRSKEFFSRNGVEEVIAAPEELLALASTFRHADA